MEIQFSRYELMPVHSLNAKSAASLPRLGALIRVKAEGVIGYSSLQPIAEFADTSIEQQLQLYRQQQPTALLQRAVALAKQPFATLLPSSEQTVKNNFLIPEVLQWNFANLESLIAEGFESFKIKVGRDVEREISALSQFTPYSLKLRLDFNGTQKPEDFALFLKQLPDHVLEKIEYIEDPTAQRVPAWKSWNKIVPLAVDQTLSLEAGLPDLEDAQVIVVKPVRQNVESFVDKALQGGFKVTVTSAMDHPLGVLQAYGYAQHLHRQYGASVLNAGCGTISLFQENEFQGFVNEQGPYLQTSNLLAEKIQKVLETRSWETL